MTPYECAGVCLIVIVMATTSDALTSSLLKSIAEHPPVYLSEPFVTLKPYRCDVTDVGSYHKIIFEGFANVAKLTPDMGFNGTMIFGFKENVLYDPPPICVIEFTWTNHSYFCVRNQGDFVGEMFAICICHHPIGLILPVSIILNYTNLFHRSREHVLHVLGAGYIFSSAPRIVKLPKISSTYGECNATRPVKVRIKESFPELGKAKATGTRLSMKKSLFVLTNIMCVILDYLNKMYFDNN